MTSSGLVLLMVPGLGLFYSGISERCSAVSMMWMSMLTTALIGVQVRAGQTFMDWWNATLTGIIPKWFLWGYSITFTGPINLWGSADSFVLHNDLTIPWGNKPGTKIPQLLYAFYQGMFACFTCVLPKNFF
jgi:Amt family ammonium transporter